MKRLLIFILLLGGNHLSAQVNGEDQLGAWYMYFGINRVSDHWSVHSEAQFRFWETVSNFNQLLLRTGMNYHLSEKAMATLGYAYIGTDTSFDELPGEVDLKENRIFQQFILKNEVGKVLFEHRYRLEQRYIDFGTETDLLHRARYRLQLTLPLTPLLFINFYDEIFINLQGNVFDQNRLYGAIGFKLSPVTSLQLGYLKNHFPAAHYDRLQLGLFINPDFRQKAVKP